MSVKVSVVIPMYNVERYVESALASILNQTLKEIEVIIINDGSSDLSLSVVEGYLQDSRIRLLSTQNNGLSVARNIGMYFSKGEYIYFFDSDDFLESTALEECYKKSKREDLDLLFFDADVFSEEKIEHEFDYCRSSKYDEDKVYRGIDILKEQILTGGYRSSACLLFLKRQYLVMQNMFFYPRILHEDELFTFLVYLKAGKVGLINKAFFHRRVRSDSIMTQRVTFRNIYGYLTVCRELRGCVVRYDVNSNEKDLLEKRVNFIISVLLHSVYDDKNKKRILSIIKNEFWGILNMNNKLRVLFPFILNLKSKGNKS